VAVDSQSAVRSARSRPFSKHAILDLFRVGRSKTTSSSSSSSVHEDSKTRQATTTHQSQTSADSTAGKKLQVDTLQ